jgi:hypothetical protein
MTEHDLDSYARIKALIALEEMHARECIAAFEATGSRSDYLAAQQHLISADAERARMRALVSCWSFPS